ncbi:MAG: DNA-binding response regulator [Desulfobulbaceae bacterium]|nr:MAG: DNA-binding response regulator [Desulfobulbaceae bacterium]
MIRVITADDHALIRQGVQHILEKTEDISVVAEAENGQELLRRLRSGKFDVVTLDLNMPGMDAFEVIEKVRIIAPDLKILVLTVHPDKRYGLQVMKAGASGYLNKSSDLTDLVSAIRTVHAGKKYIGPSLAEKLADTLDEDYQTQPHELLSEREFQVLCWVAKGKTLTEIASQLNLSTKTISTYRRRLLDKMKLENNAQLTYYAIENRLV